MTSAVVKGHGLRGEGRAYVRLTSGNLYPAYGVAGPENGYGRWGFGVCRCGQTSDWLKSNGLRRAWHRDHKTTILNTTH